MSDTAQQLAEIEKRVRALLAENRQLRQRCARLEEAHATLAQQQEKTQKALEEKERDELTLRLGALAANDPATSEQLRQELDRLIREVDRCIRLLKS